MSIEKKLPLKTNIPEHTRKFSFFAESSTEIDHLIEELMRHRYVCLRGPNASGKTSIAKKLALALQDKFEVVWWLDADTSKLHESLVQFEGGYENRETSVVVRSLEEQLKGKSFLIIYDNAYDLAPDEKYFGCHPQDMTIGTFFSEMIIEAREENQRILITSRSRQWTSIEGVFEHSIEGWSLSTAMSYMHSRNITVKDENELQVLGTRQILPLTATMAANFIKSSGRSDFQYFTKNFEKSDAIEFLSNKPHDYRYRSLLVSTKMCFDGLTPKLQRLLVSLSFFGPDELPVELIANSIDESDLNHTLAAPYASFSKDLDELVRWSFLTIGNSINGDLVSMHRMTQLCIQEQTDTQAVAHHQSAMEVLYHMLIKTKNTNPAGAWQIIPHVDFVYQRSAKFITGESPLLAQLLFETALIYTSSGENVTAENLLRGALRYAGKTDKEYTQRINKKLASILFLKGKSSLDEAMELGGSALAYYKDQKQFDEVIDCLSSIISKIHQRKCEFQNALSSLNLAYEFAFREDKGKISGILHNFGSLHWTRGEEGDYEKSSQYFLDSIKLQEDQIAATADAKSANNKKVVLNISRMIYGAVCGLMRNFEEQAIQHQKALAFFRGSGKNSDKRRLAYTAYYALAYGLDKESLDLQKPKYFQSRDFSMLQLVKDIMDQEIYLAGDEKYGLINLLVKLRISARWSEFSDHEQVQLRELFFKNQPDQSGNISGFLSMVHDRLFTQLAEMRYGNRYYDVDTCSASAFLDYALWLSRVDPKKATEVSKQARAITQNIVFHRQHQLENLHDELKNRMSKEFTDHDGQP